MRLGFFFFCRWLDFCQVASDVELLTFNSCVTRIFDDVGFILWECAR